MLIYNLDIKIKMFFLKKLKLEKLSRNAENIDFILYVIKLLNFKLKKPKFNHFKKTFEK